MKVRVLAAVIIAALGAVGCSMYFRSDGFDVGGSLFREDAKRAKQAAQEQAAMLESLICAGVGAAQVEAMLRNDGVPAEEASRAVILALANAKCAATSGR